MKEKSYCEVTISMSNAEQKFKQRFLCYEPVTASPNDPVILSFITECRDDFKGTPEKTTVSILVQC